MPSSQRCGDLNDHLQNAIKKMSDHYDYCWLIVCLVYYITTYNRPARQRWHFNCIRVVLKPELEMAALLAMPATSAPQELYEVQMNMFDCVMALSCVKKDLWVARILQLFSVSRSSGISPVDKTLFIISVSKQSMRRTVANKCNESRHKFGCIASHKKFPHNVNAMAMSEIQFDPHTSQS